MFYRELAPRASLGRLVHCIWILEHDPGPRPAPEKILPDGRPELIFNLGVPYRRLDGAGRADQPTAFVIGQLRRYLEVVPAGRAAMLGVRFQPAVLHRLLAESMGPLTDRSVPLAELGQRDLVELEERLHTTAGWPARIRLVEDALERRLPRAGGQTGEAAELIRRTHGRLDLAEVAGAVGMSTRTLERRFGTEVGLPPKLYSRQVRFHRVFELLARAPRPNLAEISLASGCYDQAHLNREFLAFAGEPPAAFLRSEHELSDHLTGLASHG